ncbi:MAG: hypothetical protein AAFX93_07060 [Verrucomicrobiota bacterium]
MPTLCHFWITSALIFVVALLSGCENVDVSTDAAHSAKLANQKRFYISPEIEVVNTQRPVAKFNNSKILDIVGEILTSKGYEKASLPSSADFLVTCQWTSEKVLGQNKVVVGANASGMDHSKNASFLIVNAGPVGNPDWSANGPVSDRNGNLAVLRPQVSAVLAAFPSAEGN